MKKIINGEPMWATLLHLGTNMWGKQGLYHPHPYNETFKTDMNTWRTITSELPKHGFNTVLIDMGEAVKLESHPELAVPGSLDKKEFAEELSRLRSLGLTPLPKFNFSNAHNAWLKDYGYMVGTEIYDKVCRDVVAETIDIFGKPEFFHLGLEEENEYQEYFEVKVMRAPRKKAEDANALFKICLDNNVRPWIWANQKCVDAFGGEEMFKKNISKDVLISNYWYELIHDDIPYVHFYRTLEEWGYDQVPTCSTYTMCGNDRWTMAYCKEHLKNTLCGYLTAPWLMTYPELYHGHMHDICTFGYAKKEVYPEE